MASTMPAEDTRDQAGAESSASPAQQQARDAMPPPTANGRPPGESTSPRRIDRALTPTPGTAAPSTIDRTAITAALKREFAPIVAAAREQVYREHPEFQPPADLSR